jgi:hypothetical protein
MQKMSLQEETNFPAIPVVGRVIFKDKKVWICVEVVMGVPAWVPLTSANNTFIHDQASSSSSWTITHNLNTVSPLVQVYDDSGSMIIPGEVIPTSNNVITITFTTAITGRAVIMFGDINVYPSA